MLPMKVDDFKGRKEQDKFAEREINNIEKWCNDHHH
jgi:hypothetical protein